MRVLALTLALCLAAPAGADEDVDHGLAPVSTLRTADLSAPTPREVPGAKTIRTGALRESLRTDPPPLLFDVLGGEVHESLPGAIWLPGAGRGTSFTDSVQARLAQTLKAITKDDRKRPL